MRDALLIATLETGVPVVALDAARVDGDAGAAADEPASCSAATGGRWPGRQIVIADARACSAVLFGDLPPGRRTAHRDTERVALVGPGQGGAAVSVEEALWAPRRVLGDRA